MVKCGVCGAILAFISEYHLESHNLTLEEYNQKYKMNEVKGHRLNLRRIKQIDEIDIYKHDRHMEYIDKENKKIKNNFRPYRKSV